MKSYYVECTVSFTDNTPNEKSWKSSETYNFIVEAKNKKEGKVLAEKRGIEDFESDFGKDIDDINLVIDQFYQTSEDARAN